MPVGAISDIVKLYDLPIWIGDYECDTVMKLVLVYWVYDLVYLTKHPGWRLI